MKPDLIRAVITVAAVFINSSTLVVAECITVRIPRPLPVSGLICGQTFDIIGDLEPEQELYVENDHRAVVATTKTDTEGKFSFQRLPKGRYRMVSPGWLITFGTIEVVVDRKATCRQPMVVYLGTSGECQGGWIWRKWDYHMFPDGPQRKK